MAQVKKLNMAENLYDRVNLKDELKPVSKQVSRDTINKYAEASGDFNPLHVDPEFAEQTIFRGVIAHGLMSIAYISEMMTNEFQDAWLEGGELDVNFLKPVRPGDVITTKGRVIEKNEDQHSFTCEVACENQESETVIVGKATIGFVAE